jgi:endonuclease/exonuclease/phosphatase (EEP) superfamily protein YafD
MRNISSKFGWRQIAAAALVVMTFVCMQLVAGRAAWWNVVSSVPPLTVLLVPALAALLLIRARRRAFLLVCMLLLLAEVIPRADINFHALRFSKSAAAGSGTDSLKVMDWNTEFWDQTDPPGKLYEFLKASSRDLYILEEYLYNTPDWKPYLIDKRADIEAAFPGYQVVTADQFVIISKYPVKRHILSKSRQALLLTIGVNGKELNAVSIHLEPHVDLGSSIMSKAFWDYVELRHKSRIGGLKEAEAFIDQAGNKPLFVTGDFNTTLLMGSLDKLRSELRDAAKYSGSLFPTTWEAGGHYLWRIDHFLYNPGLSILSYTASPQPELSDHKALLVDLQIK